ncbi:MAG: alpha-amylase [Gammaproteobacteria bacterium]|nr:MAG: alpha-amylase [Gammaproteobacteria bacterium]
MDELDLFQRVVRKLSVLYPEHDCEALAHACLSRMRLEACGGAAPAAHSCLWSQRDAVVITYADSVICEGEPPLRTLERFLTCHLGQAVSVVHVLPFFPYSSDDGFSVMDYTSVNPSLGDWADIRRLAERYTLMGDVVLNHCSARSLWFENFRAGREPGRRFFITADPDADLADVVRPRTTPLLTAVETVEGEKHVWTTFSPDQVDLNFAWPEVLLSFLDILRLYLDQGIRWFRLDAVAFVWKRIGTPCIHLKETHVLVRLLRLLLEHAEPRSVVITETNVPNVENLSYFGNANEAHMVYNFALPPLVVHSVLSGNTDALRRWLMTQPPAQPGTTYFNFIASHDGIGLRPAEGLLAESDMEKLLATTERQGGRISYRVQKGGQLIPYELNVSLWGLVAGTHDNENDGLQLERFVAMHTFMMALEGVPAFYIHSLLATPNDLERMAHSGHNRAINRHKWEMMALYARLEAPGSTQSRVLSALCERLRIRKAQSAFHPNATQFTLQLPSPLVGVWRQSRDRRQSVFALHNLSDQWVRQPLADLNLVSTEHWRDLLSGELYSDHAQVVSLAPYQCIWLTNEEAGAH